MAPTSVVPEQDENKEPVVAAAAAAAPADTKKRRGRKPAAAKLAPEPVVEEAPTERVLTRAQRAKLNQKVQN